MELTEQFYDVAILYASKTPLAAETETSPHNSLWGQPLNGQSHYELFGEAT
ncbi:MAG: hypothetical protein ACI9G1_003785 [Pirellulaceae bacterium]|jgi:hypothetical protein